MGTLTRSYNWSGTKLGDPGRWPLSLRVLVNMVLTSKFPMLLFWGDDLITFYNDAFRPSLGNEGKHPSSLGQRGEESWAESWPTIGPLIYGIMAGGEAVWFEDQKLPIYRYGKMDYAYWTYSFSPVMDDAGSVAGVLVTCSETTKAVENLQQIQVMQQHLEKSRQQLLGLFTQSTVAVAIIGKEALTFRVVNPFYCELVGRASEELIGKPFLDVLPELAEQGFEQLLMNVIETGVPYISKEVAVGIRRSFGPETIYVDLTCQPLREEDNEISGILVIATDVTEQVRSRKRIEESEVRFRTLIEEAPIATCLFVGSGLKVEVANDRMLGVWGKDRSAIGKPLVEAVPELKGQPFLGILSNIFITGKSYTASGAEAKLKVDGNLGTYYFNFTYKPLFNSEGKVYAIMNMAMDVTEQVLARRKLVEAEQELRSATELAGLAAWSLNISGETLSGSDRLQEWIGFDINGKTLNQLKEAIPEEEREKASAEILAALSDPSQVYNSEHTVVNQLNGQKRIIHNLGRVFLNESGQPIALRGAGRDITLERQAHLALENQVQARTGELSTAVEELAEANRQLLRSNEELAQYAYVASHDLQEPLRKIRMFATSLLAKQENLPGSLMAFVQKIDQSAQRMSMLISDLLDFSRLLKSDTLVMPVSLPEVVGNVVNDFELLIEENKVSVSVGQLPHIQGVRLQMNQLFYNLLNNAIKFRKEGVAPSIRIHAVPISQQEAGKHISWLLPFAQYYDITVSDNGIGFDTQYADQIFEVFKRLHAREKYPGSGIGLAICRRIADNHKGKLFAESAPGQGSVFHLILPDKQHDHQAVPSSGLTWANQ